MQSYVVILLFSLHLFNVKIVTLQNTTGTRVLDSVQTTKHCFMHLGPESNVFEVLFTIFDNKVIKVHQHKHSRTVSKLWTTHQGTQNTAFCYSLSLCMFTMLFRSANSRKKVISSQRCFYTRRISEQTCLWMCHSGAVLSTVGSLSLVLNALLLFGCQMKQCHHSFREEGGVNVHIKK